MTIKTAAASALLLAATVMSGAAEAARPLAVVELFTSQGCSSCPPANANLAKLAERPEVLALSFGVTYWDDLGWKDTFARPAFTARQWSYAHALHHSQVWTPQVVVNGRRDVVGQQVSQIEGAWRAAPLGAAGPRLDLAPDKFAVAAGNAPRAGAEVWLVRYDPATIEVPIKRGENGGKTLPHRNVVRQFVRLGTWTGQARTYALPPVDAPNLRTAILVQGAGGGPILSAAKS
jgi:hypothetical protein